jgi:hypothetical protein
MPSLNYLLARFSEPSSYAGLGALLALIGWNLSDPVIGQLAQMFAAGCALLAVVLRERHMIGTIALVFALVPALSGCAGVPAAVLGGLGSAGSALMAFDKLSEATSPYIASACGEYGKAKAAAAATIAAHVVPNANTAKLSSIVSFGDAACANPPAGDPLSTAIWLGQLAGQITTLAEKAKGGG